MMSLNDLLRRLLAILMLTLASGSMTTKAAEGFANVAPADLYSYCRTFVKAVRNNMQAPDSESLNIGMCLGYVFAALDIEEFEDISGRKPNVGQYRACIPEGFTPTQRAEVVAVYLDNHPELQAKIPYMAVLEAMAKSFPCP